MTSSLSGMDPETEVRTEWERKMAALPTHTQRVAAGEYAVAWMGLLVELDAPVNADTVREIMAAALTYGATT